MSSTISKKSKTLPKKVEQSSLPTSHTDGVNIGVRGDGLVFLQLFSETPVCSIENHRTMMRREAAILLIDALAGALDHYPQKDS
jgi:hypothetical protein